MSARRDPWLDNAKMILVTLVVIGHAFVLVPVSNLQQQAYDFIYYFHIPLFVLVTGYLSRSFRYTPRHLWGLVTTLLVPYLIFSWLMVQWRAELSGGPPLDPIWTNPRWPMWYLAVLIMWRLATPVLRAHWLMVPASIAVSLLAGGTDQELFDLNRALGLLPFFVIGLHLTPQLLELPRRRFAWVAGLVVLGLIWWLADHTNDFWSTSWLYYSNPYENLEASVAEGAWVRARLIPIALAGSFAVLSLVPKQRTFLSDMGAYTLVVYLLHGFPIRYAGDAEWARFLPENAPAALVITVALAVGLALLLGWPPLARRLNYLVDPINSLWRPKSLAGKAVTAPLRKRSRT